MAEQKELFINGESSGFLIYAPNHFDDGESLLMLKSIDGWDDPKVELSTIAKGNGVGSYLISSHVPERELSIVIQSQQNESAYRTLRRQLSACMFSNELLSVSVTIYASNGNEESEEMTGYLKGVVSVQDGADALLTLTITCLDPEKNLLTATPSGSTTQGKGL